MKKIVFDLDGTLLNSTRRHEIVLKDGLRSVGDSYADIGIEDYLSYKSDGNSTYKYLTVRLNIDEGKARQIASFWVEKIENLPYLRYDFLYDDAIPTLEMCVQNHCRLYLLTARKSKENLFWQAEQLKLNSFFKEIYCVSPQNAAENKLALLKKLHPDLIIGDTEADWEAANASGTPCYMLDRGFRSAKFWKSKNIEANHSLDHVKACLSLLRKGEII